MIKDYIPTNSQISKYTYKSRQIMKTTLCAIKKKHFGVLEITIQDLNLILVYVQGVLDRSYLNTVDKNRYR